MNFIKNLWNRIVSSNDEPYILKIKELETELNITKQTLDSCEEALIGEIENYNFMKEQYESMQNTKNELLEELETYKKVEVPFTIPTDIIDTSKQPYLPSTLIYYYDPKLKKVQTKSVQVTPSKYYRMWTDEMYMFFRNAIKTCNTFDEKVVKLRNTIKS